MDIDFEKLWEEYNKAFEMPETYKCDCKRNLFYDKKSPICRKCLSSASIIKNYINAAFKSGDPEKIALAIEIMLK